METFSIEAMVRGYHVYEDIGMQLWGNNCIAEKNLGTIKILLLLRW